MKNYLELLKTLFKKKIEKGYQFIMDKFSKNNLNQEDDSRLKYKSLAPQENLKSNYTMDMLRNAIDDEKNKNVALSGKFGSGKTSTIKSLLKDPKYKPLYISLGMMGISDNNFNIDPKGFSKSIEKSIIQQIIYTESKEKFPNSNIKRISNFSIKNILITFVSSLIIISIIMSFILYTLFGMQDGIVSFIRNDAGLFSILMSIILSILITFMVLSINKFKESKKEKLLDEEIETDSDEEFLINKYMDELIYFFEKTDYNIVVIEDLDRFLEINALRSRVLLIFQKLKELNQILNSSKSIGRRIPFLYAVKDDIFNVDIERTKFFDFIVPKIPEISNYNSYAKLKEIFKDEKIDDMVFQEIAPYIDDYRVITNIQNEYILYSEAINAEGIIKDRLFAMVAYKNILPDKFEELMNNHGELYEFITKRDELYLKKMETLRTKISENEEKIKQIKKEKLKDVKELKFALLGSLMKPAKNSLNRQDGITKETFLSDEYDVDTIENGEIRLIDSPGRYYDENELFSAFGGKKEFVKRARDIEWDMNKVIDLEKENREAFSIMNNIMGLRISEILDDDTREFVEKFKLDDFEKMLLINNFIDESYKDYIFYYKVPEEMSRGDYTYMLNVRQGVETKFDYHIKAPKEVVRSLNKDYFSRDVILNYDILKYLIEKESINIKLGNMLRLILKLDKNKYKFLSGYFYRAGADNEKLIKALYNLDNDFIYNVLKEDSAELSVDKDYIVKTILNSSEVVKLLGERELYLLREYISRVENFEVWMNITDEVKDSLMYIGIKFARLSINIRDDFLEFIYMNNLYEINGNNIEVILKKSGFSDVWNNKNLTLIMQEENLYKLKEYVLDNINEYVEKCFLKTNGVDNHEKDIIELLNNPSLSFSLKESIIEKLSRNIRNLSQVNQDLYDVIIEKRKVNADWENIELLYNYKKQVLDDALCSLLEADIDALETESIEGCDLEFLGSIARSSKIEENTYRRLLDVMGISLMTIVDENSKEAISNDRLKILIEKQMLEFTAENVEDVFKQIPESIDIFINNNINKYIKNIDEYIMDSNLIENIILSKRVRLKDKTRILEIIDPKILTEASTEYIAANYRSNGISKINDGLKEEILFSNTPLDTKIKLIEKEVASGVENEKMERYMSLLDEPYNFIGKPDATPKVTVPKTREIMNILDYLRINKKWNITCSISNDMIIIYNHK